MGKSNAPRFGIQLTRCCKFVCTISAIVEHNFLDHLIEPVCNAVTIMLSDLLRCEVGCNQGHICNNIHFDTPFFILPTVLRDKDDPLRNFFSSQTFQPFSFFHIHLFISGLPLNGWACQPFIAEGLDPEGDLFIDYILLVSLPFVFVFSKGIFTSPQLRGRYTTIVGRLHHSCGEGTPQLWGNNDKGDKNNFLA